MNDVDIARPLLRDAHDSIKQVRKYTGKPYWTHTERVAEIVSQYTSDEDVIIAALAHDLKEDVTPLAPEYNDDWILNRFGARVLSLVDELTDQYTKERYPTLVRADRKELERFRLKLTSPQAKLIKLADLLDNTEDIAKNDEGFAKTYLTEKLLLLPLLSEANKHLFLRVYYQLTQILHDKRWEVTIKEKPPVLTLDEVR
jgi:(p)ppGpp synthase/HD superfamily hydrolase